LGFELRGNTPALNMAAAEEMIQLLKSHTAQLYIVQKEVPGGIEIQGAFVLEQSFASEHGLLYFTELLSRICTKAQDEARTAAVSAGLHTYPTVFPQVLQIGPTGTTPLELFNTWKACDSWKVVSDWEVVSTEAVMQPPPAAPIGLLWATLTAALVAGTATAAHQDHAVKGTATAAHQDHAPAAAGASRPPTLPACALLQVTLLGRDLMLAANAIIQFLRLRTGDPYIIRKATDATAALPDRLDMLCAFALRPSGPTLEQLSTQLNANWDGFAAFPNLEQHMIDFSRSRRPAREWLHGWTDCGWDAVVLDPAGGCDGGGAAPVALSQTAAAGTGFTVQDACDAILKQSFQQYHRRVEEEEVGKVDASGNLVFRTLSWLIVPLMTYAIMDEAGAGLFPALPVDGSGGAEFKFSDAVRAVRTLLDGKLKIKSDDIVRSPKGGNTLYFSQQLQNDVIDVMGTDFMELWRLIEKWIAVRFESERKALPAPKPAATPAGPVGDAATATPPQTPAAHGIGANPNAHPDPATTPVGTTGVVAAAAAGGGGSRGSAPPAGAGDRLLLKAFADVGLDPRRVHIVHQPESNSAALQHFQEKGKELAAAGSQRGDFENPAGHRWVLLAMPGQCQAEQYAAAASLFQPPDSDSTESQSQHREVYLASASEYSGVGVLARALLGSRLSSYADRPESSGPSESCDFWTVPCYGKTQFCLGYFQNPQQLLPIYTIVISDRDGQQGSFSNPANFGDSFSAPEKDSTDSDTKLADLRSSFSRLQAKFKNLQRKRRNEMDAASRARRRADVEGCHRVSVAGQAVEATGLEGATLVAEDDAEAALGESSDAKKKPRRVQGEVARDKLIVESMGGKEIRRAKSGHKIGGLRWKDTEMAGAVANWSLYSVSFRAAGKTTNAGLRTKGVRFWFKAAPLRHYNARRRLGSKTSIPEIPLVDVSERSMRDGVFAMELAKNYHIHERLRNAQAAAICSDYTTVGDKSVQGTHLRTFDFEEGGTDGAGTLWLIVIATSMVMDVWPVGDKMLEEATYEDESGVKKLPVEAPRALAAQLIYAGILWIIMACRCLSLTFDGGGEGTGLGNKGRARETMAGENSYLDLVWLKRSAADSAFEMLNERGVFVPLMDFYGLDWEKGEFLTRRQDSQSSLAPDGDVAGPPPSVRLDLTEDPDSDAAEPAAAPRIAAMRPIFDPLAGPADPAQPAISAMSFFDFVVWDMARACPFLLLADTASWITEDMVARTEAYVECLLDATFENILSEEEFLKVIPQEGFKRLKPGVYATSDAAYFVMAPMTLAMGGCLLTGKGGYMDEPPSPLIQVVAGGKIHVLDTLAAANKVDRHQQGQTSGYFESRRGLSAGCKAVVLGPDDTVFVGVHRPSLRHFVSMVVENLGASDDTAARMTVADSLPSPSFNCPTHDALRIAFRKRKLIGKEHEVDHFGLALPQQNRPDCAFYMLTYLATVLTDTFLRPVLWGLFTRLMRCWTVLLVFRELVHGKAVHEDAEAEALREWNRKMRTDPPPAAAADIVVIDRYTEVPVPLVISGTAAEDAARMEADENAADQARRKLLVQKAQARSEELKERARTAWKSMERVRPRHIDTGSAVPACRIPPMCARGSAKSEEGWKNLYDRPDPTRMPPPNPTTSAIARMQMYRHYWPKDSMLKSPARYFPMVKQSEQNPVPVTLWCGRHRLQAFTKGCCVSQDRYPDMAEGCITVVRNAYVWPRLKAHIQTYVGATGLQADSIHKAVRKRMRLRVDRCGPPKGTRMEIQGDSEAPSFLEGLTGRIKKSIFTRPQVSAATRWGTRFEGQWQLGVNGRAFAAGLIQATGDGTTKALEQGAAAPFQESGFQVDGSLRMSSASMGKHLRCLTSQKFSLYHAIGRFLCVFVVRPMLLAYSAHLECPASAVCGVSSYFRRFLHLVTDEMFVGLFNSADGNPTVPYRNTQALGRSKPFTGTSRKFDDQTRKKKSDDAPSHSIVKLAHRGWASLRGSHKTMFLINPKAKVQKVLGPFATPEMVGGVRALLCDLRRTSEMEGNLELFPTLENRWKELETARTAAAHGSNWRAVVAAGKDKPVVRPGALDDDRLKTAKAVAGARYAHNMHKAQWAVREIMHDVVRATEKWFDHELYSLFGFLACMLQTRWVSVRKVATGETMRILVAHEDSIANGQVGSRVLDELGEQFRNQGEDQFLDYYPPQLTDLLNDEEAMRQFPEFLRGDAMHGFVLLDAEGQVVYEDTRKKDENGKPITIPVVPGPAPLWRFPALAKRLLKLFFRQMTSNDVERVFSLVARGFRGGGKNVGYQCISSWCRRRDWVSGRFFGMEVNPDSLKVYGAARRLMRENAMGFRKVFTVDLDSSEKRKRWRQQEGLPAYMKGGASKFAKTNIVPYNNESAVGPQKESGNDTTALAADPTNPRANRAGAKRRSHMAARLAALKRKQSLRPRAKATVSRTGKRNQPGSALPVPQLRSKRARSGSADADSVSGRDHDTCDDALATLDPSPASPGADAGPAAPAAGAGVGADAGPAAAAGGGADSSGTQVTTAFSGSTGAAGRARAAARPADGAGGATGTVPADGFAATAHSGAATSRSSGTKSSHAGAVYFHEADPNSHPHVLAMQRRMDYELGGGAGWKPSVRVPVTSGVHSGETRKVFGMQRPDGEVHIVRSDSPCTLNLAFDYSGDGGVKLIKICKAGVGQSSLNMEYYCVYPSEKAIQEAGQEEDGMIVIADADGNKKSYTQVGRKTLREKAKCWAGVALHHAGDMLQKSTHSGAMNLGNIVGTVAWVTKETLERPKTKLSKQSVKALVLSLKALGIPHDKAVALAADPIFLACNFGERKPALTGEDQDVDDDADTGEESEGDESVRVKQAKPADARTQRSAASAAAKRSRERVGGGDCGLDSV